MEQNTVEAKGQFPVLTIIAGAILVISLFTPRFLVTLPVMATVGLCVGALFRRETPKPLPFVVGGLSVALLIAVNSNGSFENPAKVVSVSNGELYKNATWEYGSAKDEMRGTTSKWATLYSPTELNFDFPYNGNNSAHIQVSEPGSIIFIVDKGQVLCHSDDHIAIKFDDGPVYYYPCDTPRNGDSTTLYVEPSGDTSNGQPSDPLEGILNAKKMVIEVEFYQSGSRQLVFNVKGLDRSKI